MTAAAAYRIVFVGMSGERVAEPLSADITRINWTLNQPGHVQFTMSTGDPAVVHARLLEREVQVWRDNTLLWWGILTKRTIGTADVTYTAQGLLWYFHRRNVGDAERKNLLLNPSFTEDTHGSTYITGWSKRGVNQPPATTRIDLADDAPLPPKVLIMHHGFKDNNSHLHQRVNVVPNRIYNVSGWFWLRNRDWIGPAMGGRGLMLDVRDAATLDANGQPTSVTQEAFSIDDSTEREVWHRADVSILVPSTVAKPIVEVRIYCPGGAIRWDAMRLTVNESVCGLIEEQGVIARRLVEHAQDEAYGKSPLNIDTSVPNTGVQRIDMPFRHADHDNIGEALRSLTEFADGIDIDVAVTPTTRTFTVHHPRKGTVRNDMALTLGGNIAEAQIDEDGEQVATRIIATSDAEGSTREEGWAAHYEAYGGLALDRVVSASGVPIKNLDGYAKQALRANVRVPSVPRVTVTNADDMIGRLTTGDTIPLFFRSGALPFNRPYRVVGIDLNPANDTMTLTLNEDAEEETAG